MIKKIALFLLLILFLLPAQKNLIADVSGGEKVFSQPYITTVMQKTAQWQIADLARTKDTRPTWINAVFYIGIMEAYEATGSEFYLNAALSFSQANNWQPGKRFRHADDLAVGQIYTKLYMIKNNLQMIQAFQNRIDQIMAQPMPGHLDWWWCDALFMAPPGIAELSDATGERKYLDYMDKQWWDTVDYLFDKNEQLFFRDKTFFDAKEPNGQPVFWSRGNGWVLAAFPRVLTYMPVDYPDRQHYVDLFVQMATRIAALQQPDGFWNPSLLDPDVYTHGETSGTGLFCYAMAWGINQGILPRDKFVPVVDKAWRALVSAVAPSGKLGWVQGVGKAPGVVTAESTNPYGVGAFLLAGSEMLKLEQQQK
ncbi:MAG TPA: glycoside hydrolase family 88 protein [Phycisphaerae bacterium]|nr:glycoside hydrolase family 88 protein [Phycisphaerae bacterium]